MKRIIILLLFSLPFLSFIKPKQFGPYFVINNNHQSSLGTGQMIKSVSLTYSGTSQSCNISNKFIGLSYGNSWAWSKCSGALTVTLIIVNPDPGVLNLYDDNGNLRASVNTNTSTQSYSLSCPNVPAVSIDWD